MQLPSTLSRAFCCLLTLAAHQVAGLAVPRQAPADRSQQNVDNSNGVGIPLVNVQDIAVPVTLDDEGPLERRQNVDNSNGVGIPLVNDQEVDILETLDEIAACLER